MSCVKLTQCLFALHNQTWWWFEMLGWFGLFHQTTDIVETG